MSLQGWISESLSGLYLTDDVEEYVLSRGAKEQTYRDLGVCTWTLPETPCPDREFSKSYGPRGEKMEGFLVTPYYSPRGEIIGFEARSIYEKIVCDVRCMPKCKWNPVWINTNRAFPILWGSDIPTVSVVEGVFDLFALEWVLPPEQPVLVSLRATLSPQQIDFLSRFCKFVNIVYDEDPTGKRASEKALRALRKKGVSSKWVRYCGGKDPGVIWDKGGVQALRHSFRTLGVVDGY